MDDDDDDETWINEMSFQLCLDVHMLVTAALNSQYGHSPSDLLFCCSFVLAEA
jgi:hypothetical protein